jgi:hypothetical protein
MIPNNVDLILNDSMIGSMKYYEAKVSKEFENNQVDWRGAVVNLIKTDD